MTAFLAACLLWNMAPSPAAASERPAGLVGYWKVNEGIGNTIYDYSGNGVSGEIIGKADWEQDVSGPVLHFDGKTGYVEVPDGPWNNSGPTTLLCWSKSEGNGQIVNHVAGGVIPGCYGLSAGGMFSAYDSQAKGTSVSSQGTPDAWVMHAMTVDNERIRTYFNGAPQKEAAISGWPRIPGALSIGARGCVPDNFLDGSVREVAIFNRVLDAGEIAAIYAAYQGGKTLYEPTDGLKLLAVTPQRVLYRPSDTAEVRVTVKNFGAQPRTCTLVASTVGRLESASEVSRQPISIPGRGSSVFTLNVPVAGQSFGCAIRAQLVDRGRPFDALDEVVGVADNAWLVGIGGGLDPSVVGRASPDKLEGIIRQARRNYANWMEMYFWAPDDWGNLNPDVDEWYSGQASYYMRRDNLKSLINLAHAQGIKMVTYGKHTACGPDGVELTRKQPEWFRPFWFDVRQIDEWNDKEARARKGARFDWQPLFPDFRRVDTLDYGIQQINDSAANFGWDGVRFDGHYTVSSDAVSTWNIRRLKETIWAKKPDFLFGFNYAFAPDSYSSVTREMKEAMAGYGMWMQEAIGSWGYGTGAGMHYTQWTKGTPTSPAFAPHELAAAKQVYGMGGQYHSILRLPNSNQGLYKLVCSLIAGAHPVYGTYEIVPGCTNWGRFMTRWSAFLWHPRLQPVANAGSRIAVDTPSLYWKPLVQEFVDTPTRKFTVIHLVNPSPDDAIKATTLPAPVDNVMVRFTATPGAKIRRIYAIQPTSEPFQQSLPVAGGGTSAQVKIPRVNVWTMVVVEESGTFAVPTHAPRFTVPVAPAELAAGRSQAAGAASTDPLQPAAVGLKLEPGEQMWETDTGYNSVTAQEATDPDAMNGLAQVRLAGVAAASGGRTWLGSFEPGRYEVRFRLKLTDAQKPPRRQTVSVTGQTSYFGATQNIPAVIFDSDETTPAERRLVVDGKYHYYSLPPLEFRQQPMLHVHMGFRSDNPDGNAAYLDHIIVKQLERFTDEQLAQWSPPNKPVGLRTPEGAAPKRILQVRGPYWQLYGLERTLPETTGAYAMPEKYPDLYAYDAIVLADSALNPSFEVRRMLRDWVQDGGRLILLGGPFGLGNGGFKGNLLEELLPFQLPATGSELNPCQPALTMGGQPDNPWPGNPSLFWKHDVTLRPGAQALAFAGSTPIAATIPCGRGRISVFAGTVQGSPEPGQTPFWTTPSWSELLKSLVFS